jgi:hypothetical protein
MQTIRWDLLPGVLTQIAIYLSILTLILTVFAAPLLKYFVRVVPLLSHAIIFVLAVARVLVVYVVVTLGVKISQIEIPSGLDGLFGLAGMCAVGWFISHDLEKRYGVKSKFPGPGAKVMFGLLAISWVFLVVYFLVQYFN